VRILLDTHTFLWFIEDNRDLSATVRRIIEDDDTEPNLSVASIWEMAIKVSIGKLELRQPFESLIPQQLAENDITLLGISVTHAIRLTSLPFHHRDPFDRCLSDQETVEQLPILSADAAFDVYGIERIW
jgi:PIN domain nuclease of toxin-antitoxin system